MSDFDDFNNDGVLNAILTMGENMTLDGVPIQGVFTRTQYDPQLEFGGYDPKESFNVMIARLNCPVQPSQVKDGVLIVRQATGKTYKIVKVETDISQYNLFVTDLNR